MSASEHTKGTTVERTPETGPLMLAIHPAGFGSLRRLPAAPADQAPVVHESVGGYFQEIGPGSWIAILNEDGKHDKLPANLYADALARALGWSSQPGDYLVGTIIFASRKGDQYADVPQQAIDLARASGIPITGLTPQTYRQEAR